MQRRRGLPALLVRWALYGATVIFMLVLVQQAWVRYLMTNADPLPAGAFEVGQIIEGAGRANFDWFKQPGLKFAVAFKAEKTGTITQVAIPWRITIKENDPKKSYGWGNYGTYDFTLCVNGKDNMPGDKVVAKAAGIMPQLELNGRDDYPLTVKLNAKLTAGELYHLVITNTEPDPGNNWSSLNTVMTRITPWDEWVKNGAGARGLCNHDGKWLPWCSQYNPWNTERKNDLNGALIPLVMTWDDKSVSGSPYWSAAMDDPALLWGTLRAGEEIVWERDPVTITTIGLSVEKRGNPRGRLLYHLEQLDTGDRVVGALANPNQVSTPAQWVYATLPTPVTLQRGQTYRLWFDASDNTDAENCYVHHPVYTPGDPATWSKASWGGAKSHLIMGDGADWSDLNTYDLSFSLQTEARK